MMEQRVGLLFLFLLGACWACDARQLGESELPFMQVSKQEQEKGSRTSEKLAHNEDLCTLCEEYAAKAVDYFSENKTQTEILGLLHNSCSRLASFKQQCVTFVDYYTPLFFLEISTIQPADFCRKVNLCQQVAYLASELRENSCGLCHRAVTEVLIKLKDPDSQLEIIEKLLKACDSAENYSRKCKTMVFKYGPMILVNAEQFLETTDVCTVLHACDSSKAVSNGEAEVKVLADS